MLLKHDVSINVLLKKIQNCYLHENKIVHRNLKFIYIKKIKASIKIELVAIRGLWPYLVEIAARCTKKEQTKKYIKYWY